MISRRKGKRKVIGEEVVIEEENVEKGRKARRKVAKQ